MRPIPVGTSKDLEVGQNAFAIGDPFGLDQTLTTGVVSALKRTVKGERISNCSTFCRLAIGRLFTNFFCTKGSPNKMPWTSHKTFSPLR